MMFLKICLIFLVLNLIRSEVIDDPYCTLRYRRLCKGKGTHVACQFPSPGPGMSCQNYSQIKFTRDLRHFITNYINRRRQRIASGGERVRGGVLLPRPQVMMLVVWDRELAYLAQRLADQCEFEHDDCRATVRYPYAGQSVGEVRWRRSSDSEVVSVQHAVRRVLDAWWGERRKVQPAQLTGPFRLETKGTVWGHFSQLAVWTLQAVGCAAVRHGSDYTRLLLVCDFSHTNMLGQRTINPGPLAPCPGNTIRKHRTSYPLLCAPVRRQTSPDEEGDRISENDDDERNFHDEEIMVKLTKPTTRQVSNMHQENQEYQEVQKRPTVNWATSTRSKRPKITSTVIERSEEDFEELITELEIKEPQWNTRRPNYDKLRQELENIRETQRIAIYDEDIPKQYKKFGKFKIASTSQEPIIKHRWKHTRERPLRPGVKALLKKPPETLMRRSSLSSLMLDQDDLDQFFRDTGFNINWRKQVSRRE